MLSLCGLKLTRTKIPDYTPYDMAAGFDSIYHLCKSYTQTKVEAMYELYSAVNYVVDSQIPGDFVECGVWKGGSSMVAAMTFLSKNFHQKTLWLYDTYSGMPEPEQNDVKAYDGTPADRFWSPGQKADKNLWNYSPIEEVRHNVRTTNYPNQNLVFIEGNVEDTIPDQKPTSISILRLDTDLYSSTYHELKYLFPLLSEGGVLIIDDYGTWEGARQATDQYFSENNICMFLHRIDEGARIGIKIKP